MSKYTPEIFKSPFSHLKYTLIRHPDDCKKIGIKKKLISLPDGANATANFIQNQNGETLVVVYMPYSDIDDLYQHGLIIHESVHIWQEIRMIMNEKNPSTEFEAYSIQKIAQDLLYLLELSNGMEKRTD